MFIYNTTFSVKKDTIEKWRNWMNKNYVPTFKDLLPHTSFEMFEVMTVTEEGSVNFSCQWRCQSPDDLEVFNKYSAILLSNLSAEYGENCLYFSSILKESKI